MKLPNAAAFARALDEDTASLVEAVIAAGDARGVCVYAVGGPVRDLLMGRPLRDVDLLVEDGAVAELVEGAAPEGARIVRHDRFGTVSLQRERARVDVAGARRETYSHPGALPRVEPGTLEDDLRRRDFSVNAFALSLSREARARHPRIVDVEDGLADLERRRLRVLHQRTFHDDPTRVLRAARLAPRLGLPLSRGSRSALRDALRDGAFGRVSGDRLRREIVKLFEDAEVGLDPTRALRLLADWHVLGAIEPGLVLERETLAPLRRIGRAVQSPPWRSPRWYCWVSALAIWLAPLAPDLRRRALRRFAIRGDRAAQIQGFPKARASWLAALERARGRGAIDGVLGPIAEDALHALHACAEPKLRGRIARYANEDRLRRFPLDGDDLVALGLDGPAIGRALGRIRTAFLDGTLTSREEGIALAREIAGRRRRRTRSARGRDRSRESR